MGFMDFAGVSCSKAVRRIVKNIVTCCGPYQLRQVETMAETFQGQVERITFSSEETGYSVCQVKLSGRRDLVNGRRPILPRWFPAKYCACRGSGADTASNGAQFQVDHYETVTPAPWKAFANTWGRA